MFPTGRRGGLLLVFAAGLAHAQTTPGEHAHDEAAAAPLPPPAAPSTEAPAGSEWTEGADSAETPDATMEPVADGGTPWRFASGCALDATHLCMLGLTVGLTLAPMAWAAALAPIIAAAVLPTGSWAAIVTGGAIAVVLGCGSMVASTAFLPVALASFSVADGAAWTVLSRARQGRGGKLKSALTVVGGAFTALALAQVAILVLAGGLPLLVAVPWAAWMVAVIGETGTPINSFFVDGAYCVSMAAALIGAAALVALLVTAPLPMLVRGVVARLVEWKLAEDDATVALE